MASPKVSSASPASGSAVPVSASQRVDGVAASAQKTAEVIKFPFQLMSSQHDYLNYKPKILGKKMEVECPSPLTIRNVKAALSKHFNVSEELIYISAITRVKGPSPIHYYSRAQGKDIDDPSVFERVSHMPSKVYLAKKDEIFGEPHMEDKPEAKEDKAKS